MAKPVAVQMKGISKFFGEVVANKDVDLTVYEGEILSLLGENGSGKTTLMNMLSGIYFPDEGEVVIEGEPVVIRSPRDAYRYKIRGGGGAALRRGQRRRGGARQDGA